MAEDKDEAPYLVRDWKAAEEQIASCINEIGRQANMVIEGNQRLQFSVGQAQLWGVLATVRLARREDDRMQKVTFSH